MTWCARPPPPLPRPAGVRSAAVWPARAAGDVLTTISAPAKLTVSLRVTGRRDDGYHLLEAEMVSVDLADELTFCDGDGIEVVAADPESASLPELPSVPSAEDNLVARALEAVHRTARVRLLKRIPVSGGLGGGSADAAAVLRWAGCFDTGVATSLGADVPFCLRGGRARVTGVGEVVEPLPFVERTFTLLTPPFGCSTRDVYRTWDGMGGPSGEGVNDLEPAALLFEPRLVRWRDDLGKATGRTPVLAGSGSTWFVEGLFPGPDRLVVRTVPPYG